MTAHGGALEIVDRRRALRQAFVLGWSLLAFLLVLVQAPAEIRAPIVIVFFCFVPGTALVGLLNADSFAVELSVSVALSVAVSGLTAGVLVYAHLWSPTAVVVILTAISLVAGLRDAGLSRRERAPLLELLRAPAAVRRRMRERGASAAVHRTAEIAGEEAGSVSGGIAAMPRAGRLELLQRRLTARRSAPDPLPSEANAAASPLHGFLLDELRQRTGSSTGGARRRRQPSSLIDLEPHELADLLSWPSLQRYVVRRVIQKVDPELWFVDDLERRLSPHRSDGLPAHNPDPPRGVCIAAVSTRANIPVAWRVLEEDGKSEWRTRLAFEALDMLPQRDLTEAVVTANTAYGSLSGFRRGLAERGLSYLVRVDPVTAAREVAPERRSHSAAEARDILLERIAAARPLTARDDPELVSVEGAEHVLLCEVSADGTDSAFWLSNVPARTAHELLASLVRLANEARVERATPELLQISREMTTDDGAGLDRALALIALALAGRVETPDPWHEEVER